MTRRDRPAVSEATTVPRMRPEPGAESALALRCVYSADRDAEGRYFTLGEDPLVFGRGRGEANVVLRDGALSRTHASCGWDEARGAVVVRDRRSSNGTWLGGRRVRAEIVVAGDLIRIGDTLLAALPFDLGSAGWAPPPEGPLRGASAQLRAVCERIAQVAATPLVVLIEGETGTGKELVARELHRLSGRRGRFVPVNCAALPDALVEAELFGHRAGAFSGASSDRTGLVREAERGTLFLDEIGELPLPLQAKLLRLLDQQEIRPVGASRPVRVDVRFVAATNRDLSAAVAAGAFREDLHARLEQWPLHIPPLRDRPDDVIPITRAHLQATRGDAWYDLDADFAEALLLHDWPRNVRELVSLLDRARVKRPEGGVLGTESLPLALRQVSVTAPLPTVVVEAVPGAKPEGRPTGRELARLLAEHGGNVSEVARVAGVSRVQVYRWLRADGLDPAAFRS